MKKILLFAYLLLSILRVDAQLNGSLPCHINANAPGFEHLNLQKRSVFRLNSGCTGTLLNQALVSDQEIRPVFLTATHCIDDGLDHSTVSFSFNYQSLNGSNGSLDPSNLDGGRYVHYGGFTLIATFNDLALCVMNRPIPPHFNVYYSGWNAIPNYNPLGCTSFPFLPAVLCDGLIPPFYSIHHPAGDIKKVSQYNLPLIQPFTLGIQQPCNLAGTLVNAVVGFFCGLFDADCGGFDATAPCAYLEIPLPGDGGSIYTGHILPHWDVGTTEGGSSGSSLFNNQREVVGSLFGGLPTGCSFPRQDFYNKLNSAFQARQAMRFALVKNAPIGYYQSPGREITCFGEIIYGPGGYTHYRFGPAALYQQEPLIRIQSSVGIRFVEPNLAVRFSPTAQYEFVAPEIDLIGNNIDIEGLSNVTLIAGVEPDCNNQKVAAPPVPEPTPYDWHAYMRDSLGVSQSEYDSTVAYLSDSLCITPVQLDSLLKGHYSTTIIRQIIACRLGTAGSDTLLRTASGARATPTFTSFIQPVPAIDRAELVITSPVEARGFVTVYDNLGRQLPLPLPNLELIEGKNSYWIDCSRLSAGYYRVQVSSGTYLRSHHLVVVR